VSRTAFVYFDSPRGTFGNVTAGNTLMEAASHALDWVTAPHWKGPRPLPSTVLDISLVGDEACRLEKIASAAAHEHRLFVT
jgi:hypothetical protein